MPSAAARRAHRLNILRCPAMPSERPPTIDPAAAALAAHRARASPWLHEEVGRRMEERLQWIRARPRPGPTGSRCAAGCRRMPWSRGAIRRRRCTWWEPEPARAAARSAWARPGGSGWPGAGVEFGPVPAGGVQMLWSKMQLHMSADPLSLMKQWHEAPAVDGFLMFSCLGPDTLRSCAQPTGSADGPRSTSSPTCTTGATEANAVRGARDGHGANHSAASIRPNARSRSCASWAPTCIRALPRAALLRLARALHRMDAHLARRRREAHTYLRDHLQHKAQAEAARKQRRGDLVGSDR